MLKRKNSDYDAPDSSIFGDVPTRTKRLFRRKDSCRQRWTPQQQNIMPELLEYILQHEEAFKNQHRLASLFADFQQQREINPDGYHANIAAWTKALSNAARAGVIPGQGTTHDLTVIRTADELARALQHPQYGKPAGLPAVFHEAVQKKEMVLVKDFMSSTTSIYKTSWIPTPWSALQWSLRTVGVLGKAAPPDKLAVRNYVVIKNVEVAGDEILKKMKEHTSTADRVLSRRDFLNRFSHMLNPASPLTNNDLNIILIHLCRDKQAISYDAQTIKFKAEHEAEPLPITEEDAAIVGLRDTLANIHAQLPPLMVKIELANAAAREAVATKQMVRAKAALRSKKLAETALAQRSDVALQLEGVYHQLQQAADQVEIVEAMRAGAAALKGLNEKVGGAEGVQGVVDAVNDQMAATEEITNIINETDTAIDEVDVEDEFEALERAEKEKKEREEAAKTAARLAQLEEAERKQKEKQAKEQQAKEQQAKEQQAKEQQAKKQQAKIDAVQQGKQTEDEVVEEEVEQASQSIASISFMEEGEEESSQEWEREPAYA